MHWKWSRKHIPDPEDAENGAAGIGATQEGKPAAQQATQNNSDNHPFWKLCEKEVATEVKGPMEIRKAELDSLLLFAGLFAAIVTAFLVDRRSHLRSDPQFIVLKEIASLLRNDTGLAASNGSLDDPPEDVASVATIALWYISLIFTLVGAFWGVLAQGWIVELLREKPELGSSIEQAVDRWRHIQAAKRWSLGPAMGGVAYLLQLGLATFLAGLVLQAFDDGQLLGRMVLSLGGLVYISYIMGSFLPWFFPYCPYRTPLTTFTNLLPPVVLPLLHGLQDKNINNSHADAECEMEILTTRLNHSSNDEVFGAAVDLLDVKLEGHDSDRWYEGVRHASDFPYVLALKLNSLADRIQKMILEFGMNEANILHPTIEKGTTYLRVFLKLMDANMSSYGISESAWIKEDIATQFWTSMTFPETMRLLSCTIGINRLVATRGDYDRKDIIAIDWGNLICRTSSDPTLHRISAISVCRGLLSGKENVRRVCALGLAMFVEVREIESPTKLFDMEFAVYNGKVVIDNLWSELVKIWNGALDPALLQTNRFGKLLNHEIYASSIKSFIPAITEQLDAENSELRQQAAQILIKLSEHESRQLPIGLETRIDGAHALRVPDSEICSLQLPLSSEDILQEETTAIRKLVTILREGNNELAQYFTLLESGTVNVTQFSQTIVSLIVSMLNTVSKPVRIEVYKLLDALKALKASSNLDELRSFFEDISLAICKTLTEMKDQDLSVICQSTVILEETTEKGLIGDSLRISSAINEETRNAVGTMVRSKLVYDENSPDRQEVILALSRLAKHGIFVDCLRPAIPVLIAALHDSDQNVWSTAVGVLSALSGHGDLRKPLIPALAKLLQPLSLWGGEGEHPLDLPSNASFTENLLTLVSNFKKSGHFTMNERLALASALRIGSLVTFSGEILVCKLEVAALLVPEPTDTISDLDYHSFFSTVFGNGNETIKSKLSELIIQHGSSGTTRW